MITEKSQKIGLGKRKTAIARVYLKKGKGEILVNGVDYKAYFPESYLQIKVESPLHVVGSRDHFDVKVTANGGGIKGQSEAAALGIARALIQINEAWKPQLRAEGLVTRDARAVERKKFGQKKARKRFQFTKR